MSPLPRKELYVPVLCTWFEAYTHINDNTSSINILDYYQCPGEILLAAAVHWELIDMTHLLYMNLEKSLSSEWFNSFYGNYKLCQETLLWVDLFPALGAAHVSDVYCPHSGYPDFDGRATAQQRQRSGTPHQRLPHGTFLTESGGNNADLYLWFNRHYGRPLPNWIIKIFPLTLCIF